MKYGYLIKETGDVEIIRPQNGEDYSLEELQKAVDGFIDIINLNNGKIMVLNDEGKFTKGLNAAATFLAHIHHSVAPRDYVAGDVVVCPSEMVK